MISVRFCLIMPIKTAATTPMVIKANTNKVNILYFPTQFIVHCTQEAYLKFIANNTAAIQNRPPEMTKAISLDMAVFISTDHSVSAMVSRPLGVVL